MIHLLAANQAINYGSWFSIVAVVIGVLGAISFLAAYTKSNFAKSTIELQSEQITAQSQRIETLEKDIERAAKVANEIKSVSEQLVSDLNLRISTLEASLKVLENIKTGADAVERLAAKMEAMFITNNKQLTENSVKLDQLFKTVIK